MSDVGDDGVKVLASRLVAHFEELPDPRAARGVRHSFDSLVIISMLAALCGADTCSGVHLFATSKEEWLRSFLRLPHGVPSPDTF